MSHAKNNEFMLAGLAEHFVRAYGLDVKRSNSWSLFDGDGTAYEKALMSLNCNGLMSSSRSRLDPMSK